MDRQRKTSRNGERGVTVVIFAISITALLAVASLVLGGSTGYSASRNAQTAADAASLAATTVLRQERIVASTPAGVPNFAAVRNTAVSVAQDNGAQMAACDVVNAVYAVTRNEADVLGPCDGTTEQLPAAAGVRVRAEETRDVPFGSFVDQSDITASAEAAATVQPVRGGFRAPFMLCARASDHGVPLLVDAPVTDPPTDPPYLINEDAVGTLEILLWANGNGFGDRNCGVEPWHGLVNTDRVVQVPSDPDDTSTWIDVDTGSRVGHIPRLLAADDACNWDSDDDIDLAAGCELALPLCVEADGTGTNAALNCVRMAVFEITYVGHGEQDGSCASINKKVVCGRIKHGGGLATGGQGVLDEADPNELSIIKLVQ